MFDVIYTYISMEMGCDYDTFIDIMDTKCSYWEHQFIMLSFMSDRDDKIRKSKQIFNNYK